MQRKCAAAAQKQLAVSEYQRTIESDIAVCECECAGTRCGKPRVEGCRIAVGRRHRHDLAGGLAVHIENSILKITGGAYVGLDRGRTPYALNVLIERIERPAAAGCAKGNAQSRQDLPAKLVLIIVGGGGSK